MRDYLSTTEVNKIIAGEVVQYGSSKNWAPVDHNSLDAAKELENHLAKFNIGLTDPKNGVWSSKRNGTRYFSAITMMHFAKNKLNSAISFIKK